MSVRERERERAKLVIGLLMPLAYCNQTAYIIIYAFEYECFWPFYVNDMCWWHESPASALLKNNKRQIHIFEKSFQGA